MPQFDLATTIVKLFAFLFHFTNNCKTSNIITYDVLSLREFLNSQKLPEFSPEFEDVLIIC